jgi:hypothetical protein
MVDTAKARFGHTLTLILVILLSGILVGCTDLASALPASPSPVPTLGRLPTVTPVQPTATLLPTVPPPPSATPEPERLLAIITVNANLRSGPGTEFAVVGVVPGGERVNLRGRNEGWFEVETAGGAIGWMSSQVLEIDPAVADSVPQVQP